MSDFKSLNLNPKIFNALVEKGYTCPTPIQLQAIPHLLKGKDLLGIAQTGTGKTAAFSLPILDNLSKNNNKVKAFLKYKSQVKNFPHPRSLKGIDVLANFRGMNIGAQYAESFEIKRDIS